VVAEGFRLLQAPVWLPRLNQPPRLLTYANLLAGAGWLDAPGLAALLSAWRNSFELLRPDMLVADHAPTALLAARSWEGGRLLRWACGSAFELPPAPGGVFAPMFAGASAEDCARSDAMLLVSANKALALLGEPPLPRLPAFFEDVHKALITLPETAHYAAFADGEAADDSLVRWAGPMFAADRGTAPDWPATPGPRVFAYLEAGQPAFEPLMKALAALGVPALVHAQGLAPDVPARLGTASLHFSMAPVRMDRAMADAALVLCHGGQGTMAAALLAGKPLLLIPTQPEQALAAQRVVAQGLGLAVPAGASITPWRASIERLLHETSFAEAARRVAARHAGMPPALTGERIAQWVADSLPEHTNPGDTP
jgi:Glycosyltransferase family 28 C-terminal domain